MTYNVNDFVGFTVGEYLVPDHTNLSHFGCVKASGLNDRKLTCIDLILANLRSSNRESFHVSPNAKDLCGRALGHAPSSPTPEVINLTNLKLIGKETKPFQPIESQRVAHFNKTAAPIKLPNVERVTKSHFAAPKTTLQLTPRKVTVQSVPYSSCLNELPTPQQLWNATPEKVLSLLGKPEVYCVENAKNGYSL